jgi:uncharacterized protein YndB with AHSA1/START domain
MTEQTEGLAVRHSLIVRASPTRAFEVFTDGISSWWPLQTHTIGNQPVVAVVIEPREGGRCYNRSADGSECDFGRVLAWEPPHRLVLAWEVSADWRYDPSVASEVEVRFHSDDEGGTRVELEHRGLEVYGEQAQQMRDTFESPEGWRGLLTRFGAAADRDPADDR